LKARLFHPRRWLPALCRFNATVLVAANVAPLLVERIEHPMFAIEFVIVQNCEQSAVIERIVSQTRHLST
jgi:hypothetical protein